MDLYQKNNYYCFNKSNLSFTSILLHIYIRYKFYKQVSCSWFKAENNILFVNLFNNIIFTLSLFFFYLLPFVIIKLIKIENLLNIKTIIISSIFLLILAHNFDYKYEFTGGGIFYKISFLLLQKNYLFFFISFFYIFFNV